MIVVSDTSVLNAFYKIQQLALLPALYGRVVIPTKVYEELTADEALANWLQTSHPGWLDVVAVRDTDKAETLLDEMDAGEAEALVLALELGADNLLMDDHEGRQIAQRWGIPVVGTLGILLRAKDEGLVVEVRALMHELMSKANFWVSESLQRTVLRQASEEK